MKLQKRLSFAKRGENFLEYKREQLIFQIRKNWKDYLSHRKKLLNEYRNVLINLNKNYKEMGKKNFRLISNVSRIQYKPLVYVSFIKEFGNLVPKIDFELVRKEQLPAYTFENTSHYLDELLILLREVFEDMMILAEKEALILNYAFNFKKINRRINSLKNTIIPNLKSEIKKIKGILEEVERENFVRLKKTKDLIFKKQKAL